METMLGETAYLGKLSENVVQIFLAEFGQGNLKLYLDIVISPALDLKMFLDNLCWYRGLLVDVTEPGAAV